MANAVRWMLVATTAFTFMALVIKWQSGRFTTGDLLFLRLGFSALWVLLLQRVLGFRLRSSAWRLHVRRAGAGCLAMGAWYHTLGVLPMGVSVTLNYMSPLFLGLLMCLYRDKDVSPSLAQLVLLGLGFLGVAVMMQPFGSPVEPRHAAAYAVGVVGAFCSAWAFKDVRALKATGESEWQMVFHFSLFGALMALPFTRLFQQPDETSATGLCWLALAGLLGAVGQLAVSKAFGRGDPIVPASLQYLSVVFSLGLGWLWFDEHISVAHLAGMAMVVGAALGTIIQGARQPRA